MARASLSKASLATALEHALQFDLDEHLTPTLTGDIANFARLLNDDVEGSPAYTASVVKYQTLRLIVALVELKENDSQHFALTESHAESIGSVRRANSRMAIRSSLRDRKTGLGVFSKWHFDGTDRERIGRYLTVSDGSAMEVKRFFLDKADRRYKREWRSPWLVPDTYVVQVPIENYLECRSFHVEVTTPVGVYIDRATLRLLNRGYRRNISHPSAPAEMILIQDDDHHADRAHLHFSRRLSQRRATEKMYVAGVLKLVLRPTYHNGLRAGFHISWMVSLALLALTLTVGWHSASKPCYLFCGVSIGTANAEAIVSLLLVVPTVALIATVRQDEHNLAKRVQARLRMRLYFLAFVLFGIGIAFAIDLRGYGLLLLLAGGTAVSAVSAVLTSVSAGYSKWRIFKKSYGRRSIRATWLLRALRRFLSHTETERS